MITDVVKVVSNDIVATMVRDALAGVVVIVVALYVVELAFFDEDPAVFAKQLFDDGFGHLSACGYQTILFSLYISEVAVYGLYTSTI